MKTIVECNKCGVVLFEEKGCADVDTSKLTPCPECGCESVDVSIG